jgi:methionine transaminase
MTNIISKLPQVGTNIFTEMSVLANEHNAINLGQGFPDFSMSKTLTSYVAEAMDNDMNQYTHMNGYPVLTALLADKYNQLYGATINGKDNVTITPGGTYAIYTALTAALQPSDEVIVFEPAYDSYIPNILVNGAIPITIALQHPTYTIDWDEVKSKINTRTRMIMINTPHNPTGAVLHESDMLQLISLVEGTNIIILSDEVYEHLIFDNKQHQSILRYPELFNRSFVSFSFGKTYHCTGWKLGYSIAPLHLMNEFRKVHQYNCFSCSTPKQVGIANYLQQSDDYKTLGNNMQQHRDYFMQLMTNTQFKPLPSYGSYFQLYDYSAISDLSEKDFAIWLTKNYGVTTIPVSAFYQVPVNNNVVRFCFAKKFSVLEQAVERLLKMNN